MRHARPLLLLAILAVLAGVGTTYYARLKQLALNAPAKPKALPPGTTATSEGWTYTHTTNQKTVVTVHADDFQEVEGKDNLRGVKIDIYHKDGNEYDHVKSDKAEFDTAKGILYSDGDVEITMGVPVDKPATGRLMVIKSSGVRLETKTGKATTDRLATFQFDRGEGKAVGAEYDPSTRELAMHSQVELIWRGVDSKSVPMKVETENLNYKEREAKVYLAPWSKMTRATMTMNAGPAVVTLVKGSIKLVETQQAHGTDQRPDRNLEYGANQLTLDFDDNNQIQKITAVDQARLVSSAPTAVTTLNADRVVMDLDTSTSDSLLKTTEATGHGVMESKPVSKPGVDPADTRVLKSEVINTKMREGGQELESVETPVPGSIEFIPNRPDQPHRWMNGDHIWIAYGEKNQIQSFRSVNVTTRTEKPKGKDAKENPPPEVTTSKDLLATFLPNSSQLSRLEQSNNFRYEAGDRKAKADHAILDQPKNLIDLSGGARVWDTTGSADADKIVLDQKSGDFTAEGNVNSTRMPDKKQDDSGGGGMLAEDEPLHARARKMRSTDNNLTIRYEGDAVLWQSANRLEADLVEIDRDNNTLKATGHVMSQLLDKAADDDKTDKGNKLGKDGKPIAVKTKTDKTSTKPASGKKSASKDTPRVFTIVKAPELLYNDDDRIAVYKGNDKEGVSLDRPDMQVKAKEIRAFLRSESSDSSLDHAFAEGEVRIHQTAPGRIRDGSSEHAEYYVDEDKVLLSGGEPQFIDNLRGQTKGEKLTWFSKDDRLLVNGVESKPVKSVVHRKKK